MSADKGAYRLSLENVRQKIQNIDPTQHRLRGDCGVLAVQERGRPAAVLVAIVERADDLTVLLTRRTEHLHEHAGQIAFPGGRIEPEDVHPEAAALRESLEEVGLKAGCVELVGRLDLYRTITGYEVTPVVGLVHPPFELTLDPFEVAEAFEVPLSFILDPVNHERRYRMVRGQKRFYYVLSFADRHIWGATAAMLVNLAQILTADDML